MGWDKNTEFNVPVPRGGSVTQVHPAVLHHLTRMNAKATCSASVPQCGNSRQAGHRAYIPRKMPDGCGQSCPGEGAEGRDVSGTAQVVGRFQGTCTSRCGEER